MFSLISKLVSVSLTETATNEPGVVCVIPPNILMQMCLTCGRSSPSDFQARKTSQKTMNQTK
jgi:hypothetical protein